MSDDVWSPGEHGTERDGFDLGEPAYGEGIPVAEAFSVRTVFEAGIAMLREEPALVLLAGANVYLIGMLPSLIRVPLDLTISGMQATGQLDEVAAQGLSALLGIGLFVMFLPLQQLVAAGAFVAFGNWLRNEDVSYSALYTSVREAIQAFLYGVIVFVITLLVMAVCLTPAGVGAYVAGSAAGVFAGVGVGGLLFMVGLVPMIYVGLGLQLGTYAVVLDDVSPVEALQISWDAANGARLNLFLLNLAIGIVGGIAGACTICLLGAGAIPVQGFAMAGMTIAWMLHSRRMEETTQWDFVKRNLPYL